MIKVVIKPNPLDDAIAISQLTINDETNHKPVLSKIDPTRNNKQTSGLSQLTIMNPSLI